MPTIDINKNRAARAAEREKSKPDPIVLKYKDWSETLPVELPAKFAKAARAMDLDAALLALVPKKRAEAFWELNPSMDDVNDIVDGVLAAYGFENEGESEPSEDS
jgi:hypothetical protein